MMTKEENILLNKAMKYWCSLTDKERFDIIIDRYRFSIIIKNYKNGKK